MIGNINSVISAQLLIANATALTTATPKNILGSATTTFLNPGVWMLTGLVSFIAAATTTVTLLQAGFNLTTATLPTEDAGLTKLSITSFTTGASVSDINMFPQIVTVGNQGVFFFLVAQATFATSTMTACGTFQAIQLAD